LGLAHAFGILACTLLECSLVRFTLLTKAAHGLLPRIFDGVELVRPGIMVTDLRPAGNQKPLVLFANAHEERGIGTLLDDVSKRYGRGSIGLGHAGIRGGPVGSMKCGMLSPR
jgi:DNA polymerase V